MTCQFSNISVGQTVIINMLVATCSKCHEEQRYNPVMGTYRGHENSKDAVVPKFKLVCPGCGVDITLILITCGNSGTSTDEVVSEEEQDAFRRWIRAKVSVEKSHEHSQ